MPLPIPSRIEAALNATGKAWRVEDGRKRRKIYVAGQYVAFLAMSRKHDRGHDIETVIAKIRRAS